MDNPLCLGVGLRPVHYPHLRAHGPTKIDWFEAITENYFDTEGPPMEMLEFMRSRYPIALHGVSLSVGSTQPLDSEYLRKLKALADRIDPFLISDHLCWSGVNGKYSHDLLPLPYTREALGKVVEKTQKVQDFIKRPILLENVSAYVGFLNKEFEEWEFLIEVANRSGCKILLDLNNVYVNAVNHRFDPHQYVDSIPLHLIAQIHVAGFTDMGTHLFDTHSNFVHEDVWELLSRLTARGLRSPILLEWDENIPSFEVLEAEAQKANGFLRKSYEASIYS